MDVGALVADRELEKVAAVPVDDPLRSPDEVVEEEVGLVVIVVVDATEADEHGHGRSQLGEELAPTGAHPFVHGGKKPLPDD